MGPTSTGCMAARGELLLLACVLLMPAALLPAAHAQEGMTISGVPEPGPASTRLRLDDDPHLLPEVDRVLEGAPGAVVRRSGGERSTLQLRGAGGHQVQVLLDDIPLGDGRGGALDLAHLPAAALDRIEVQRGAAAAAWGSGAQGGVVRLHTRHGALQRFRLQIGSFGARSADAAVAAPVGPGDLLGTVAVASGTGDFPFLDTNGQRRVRQNNAHSRLDGLVRLRTPLGAHADLTVLASGLAAGTGEPGLEQFEQPDAHSHTRRGLAAAGVHADGPAGTDLGFQIHHLARAFTFADPAPAFAGAARRFDLRDGATGARLAVEGPEGRLRPGLVVEGRHETARTVTTGGDRPGQRSEARSGGAITGNLLWNQEDTFLAQAAVRLDETNRRAPLWVPALDLALRLTPWTLRAHGGRLFRDPGFDELYFEATGLRGNPDLRPEDGWGADVGVDLRLGRVAQVGLTAFVQRYDRIILYVPLNAWLIQPTDDHHAEARGLEVEARAARGPWRGRLAALLQQTTLDGGPPLPFRPTGLTTTELRYLPDPIDVFVIWQWQSSVTADPFGHRTLPARHTFDLGAAVALRQVRLGVEVRNLLDQQDTLDAVQQPLPGRVVLAGLSWQP